VAADLVLLSPLTGWAAPLDEVPDPVFAERMLGDGLAIEPTEGLLKAPCDAVVVSIHAARHAVSLRSAGGVEILIHLGLETVALNGEGFEVHVADGQSVSAGQPLISFDLDLLARKAKSLISPVLITDLAGRTIAARFGDRLVTAGEPLIELSAPQGATAEVTDSSGPLLERRVVVPLVHGLHARPAARVAETAKGFAAQMSVATVGRRASAKSPVGLMTLGLRHGDTATLTAIGPDAAAALDAVAALIESGMGEGAPVPVVAEAEPTPLRTSLGRLRGVMAAPGLAVGKAVRLFSAEVPVVEAGAGTAHEEAALTTALVEVRARIATMAGEGDKARRAILGAHMAFLEDPELTGQARRRIGEGKSAGFAWKGAVGDYVEALRALRDPRMAERIDDLVDLERRVLLALAGDEDRAPDLPSGSILLAEELLPSQLMALDASRLAGICTARGGPTSHVAILAAAMGVPCLVAAGPGVASVRDGTCLILDADAGSLQVAPDAAALEAAQTALAARHQRRTAARAAAREDCRMADGSRIEVFANLGSLADAQGALAAGAEGCGLLRTEFLFLDRDTAPDEDEQVAQYRAIAEALEGRPLIVRLLDVGGDKTAAYLPIAAEENPALGVRGIRVALRRPHLLTTQLRAILRGAPAAKIMVPMVASLSELRAVRAALDEARRDLAIEGRTDLGVMIETPAAAMIADQLAAEVDFLSIGTNDLTQYTLAMDRGNPELAAEVDALHPAVLRLIAAAAEGGRKHALWTGVCGGLAGDLAAAPILIGLGVTELSMPSAAIPEVKAMLRTLSPEACRKLAAQALVQDSPEAVRALSNTFLTGGA
jgi:multiphosphoryl transfer protein